MFAFAIRFVIFGRNIDLGANSKEEIEQITRQWGVKPEWVKTWDEYTLQVCVDDNPRTRLYDILND